jgi:hypothetical protein
MGELWAARQRPPDLEIIIFTAGQSGSQRDSQAKNEEVTQNRRDDGKGA